jgi:hypothetical protein
MIVRNWTNININNLSINQSNLEILYKNNPLIIQIPKGYINPINNIFNNSFIHYIPASLSFNNNKYLDTFYQFIHNLETHIYSTIEHKLKIKHSINKSKKIYFNLKIQVYRNKPIISIFDNYNSEINSSNILPHSEVISLITPKKVYKSLNNISIDWLLLQIKVFPPIIKLDTYLINDSYENTNLIQSNNSFITINEKPENNNTLTKDNSIKKPNINNEKYDKFIKMKKMGVPIPAIITELNKFPELSKEEFYKIAKISDEMINFIKKKPNKKFTKQTKLDNINNLNRKSTSISADNKNTKVFFQAPSQSDIQNMLKKLKPAPKKKA